MLPLPKLDDRSYDEIREELREAITRHCPEWTNHNAADPGIALIELFTALTEMTQYRLNRVPEKNYLAFLDLLGVEQRLPSPSRTLVHFTLSPGFEAEREQKSVLKIPAGTELSTLAEEEGEPIPFQTDRDLYASNLHLFKLFTKLHEPLLERYATIDHTPDREKKVPFTPLETRAKGANKTMLYLRSAQFAALDGRGVVTLLFRLPTGMRQHNPSPAFFHNMAWSYFDGETWRQLAVRPAHKPVFRDEKNADVYAAVFEPRGRLLNPGTPDFPEAEEGLWIRGELRELPAWLRELTVYEVGMNVKSLEEGIAPDGCMYLDSALDLNANFAPFGMRPKNDPEVGEEIFYVRSEEALGRPGTQVSLRFAHSQNPDYVMPEGNESLRLAWEYSNGESRWRKLEVEDATKNLTRNGTVSFTVPEDMEKVDVGGEEASWIRCRIDSGHYGKEAVQVFDAESGEMKTVTPSTLYPPVIRRLTFHYETPRTDLERAVSLANNVYKTVTFEKHLPVGLFTQTDDRENAFYLGFDGYVNEEPLDLYFLIDEESDGKRNLKAGERLLTWEVLVEGAWKPIEVHDRTDHLTCSGSLRLHLPRIKGTEEMNLSGERLKGMWVRARLLFNAMNAAPPVQSVWTNAIAADQVESVRGEYLQTALGLPGLECTLSRGNLAFPPEITVGGIAYKAVSRFSDAGPDDPVFTFNGITGQIRFGDGRHGALPPVSDEIYAEHYRITLGKGGNVAKGKIRELRQSIPYVAEVDNPLPAIGGSAGDTLDDLKRSAPTLIASGERAVTLSDYEALARTVSSSIVGVKALLVDEEIVVVVLTADWQIVNRRLLGEVNRFLKERSPVTVIPYVRPPTVVELEVRAEVSCTQPGKPLHGEELEAKLENAAKKFLDPVTGGSDGKGYPIGRMVTKADFYQFLNAIDPAFYFQRLEFVKNGVPLSREQCRLEYDEIVRFTGLEIEEMSYDV